MQEQKIGRPLAWGEIALLDGVFRGDLRTRGIFVYGTVSDRAGSEEKKYVTENEISHTGKNSIHLLGDDYSDDISKESDWAKRANFVHEAAHVWQYQKTGDAGYRGGIERQDDARQKALSSAYDTLHDFITKAENQLYACSDDDTSNAPEFFARYIKPAIERDLFRKTDSLRAVATRLELAWKADKKTYLKREDYDPMMVIGPLDEYERPETAPHRTSTPWDMQEDIWSQSHLNDDRPRPGERLSDFLWRQPGIRTQFKSCDELVRQMKEAAERDRNSMADEYDGNTDPLDYNYRLQRLGSVDFFSLRSEAQAQVITDYYLLKNGIDPRTIRTYGLIDFKARPKMAFFEHIIPFLWANPNRKPTR